MSAGAPSPDWRDACSPSASESRFSSWRMRAVSRRARSQAASRSACKEARVTPGPAPAAGGWLGVELPERVAVPVEERAVDSGLGDAGDADLCRWRSACGPDRAGGAQKWRPAPPSVRPERCGAGRLMECSPGQVPAAGGGHAEADRAVLADDGDGLADGGAFFGAEQAMSPLIWLMSRRMRVISSPEGVASARAQSSMPSGGEALAGAEQVIEVSSQVGQVGHVGAEVVAAGAAEPDRAGAPAGGDVGRLGAGAVGDGDLPDGVAGVLSVQQGAGRRARSGCRAGRTAWR